jgi:glycosyltransferase involved in cell wall biosynthesis
MIMKIAYYTTIPSPAIPGTESIYNDIGNFVDHFDGERMDLYPFKKPYPRFPWQIIGLHKINDIKKLDKVVDLHHIFSVGLFPFPVLRILQKPVVYTVASGICSTRRPLNWPRFTVVVESERDFTIAKTLGFNDCRFVRQGVDCSRIKKSPLLCSDELMLLSASAPWTAHQFKEKGFHLLFEAVSRRSDLRLVILMRGILDDVLEKQLKSLSIENRVTVINGYADINELLAHVHGTVVLTDNPCAIRAYPHSLIESLAAGKPVILSDTIPMADYVKENKVGCAIPHHTIPCLENALDEFIQEYGSFRANAEMIGGKDFMKDQMIDDYSELYTEILDSS